jgi:SAM-dependent methyltransferase
MAMPVLQQLLPFTVRRAIRRVLPLPGPDLQAIWARDCQKWLLASAGIRDGKLHAAGWLAADDATRPHVAFRINGKAPDGAIFPFAQPTVAERLPFAPGGATSGFDLESSVPDGTTDVGDLVIEAIDRRTGGALGDSYRPLAFPAAARWGPLPDARRTARVIGASDAFAFRHGGWMAFRELAAAVRDSTGRDLSAFPRVLDWGCGCGRIARHFLNLPGTKLTGADVDADNVDWCRKHLAGGTWETLPLRPRTACADGAFDLVYGVSVLTHLKESDQFEWLAELKRVLRPGGLALLTFHGSASLPWAGISGERYAALRRNGICDQANPIYDADLDERDYYRDTFHTEAYVRREWGAFFDVLAIRRCAISHQDLAVLKRKN